MLHRPTALSVVLTSLTAFATGQASWHRLYPTVSPTPRNGPLLGCVESTGQCVLLFGQPASGWALNEAWNWTGTGWVLSAAALPPARHGGAMVWDAARQRLVLFAGTITNGPKLQDLWEWDGSQWMARTPAASPPVRESHGMAFDRVRGVVVMFGGSVNSGEANDTWTWNGVQWLERTPAQRPAARTGVAMAFDPVGGGVLLYGGNVSGIGWTDETWFWDGTNWSMRTPATPPYTRTTPGMVTDQHRNRIILYGGSAQDTATWEWDGTQWSSQQLPGPGPRFGMGIAYDPTRRQTLFFGGHDNWLGNHFDTWAHFTPSPALAESYGSGCPGSNGVPGLAADSFSLPWLGDTFTTRATNLAPAAAGVVFATGFQSTAPISLAPFGMPGCDQLMIPAMSEFRLAAAGAASWSLSIPNTTSLANVHLFQQAFALDPAANALGLTASNGVAITIGIR